MNKVALLREPGDGHHVKALPPWLGPTPDNRTGATYWHQPRSARIWTPLWSKGGEVLFVILWCGPHRHIPLWPAPGQMPAYMLTDAVPDDLKCGICAGRRDGHARADGLIFAPRDHFGLPTWCPGEGGPGWPSYCVACGHKVRARNHPYYGEAPHRPTPELLDRCRPCPQHGWADVGMRDGRLVCGRGWYQLDRCGHECGPQ